MGLDDEGWDAGDRAAAPLLRGDRAERPHPPDRGAPRGRDSLRDRASDGMAAGGTGNAGGEAGSAHRRAGLATRGSGVPDRRAGRSVRVARPVASGNLTGVEAPSMTFDGIAFERAYRAG